MICKDQVLELITIIYSNDVNSNGRLGEELSHTADYQSFT